MGGSVPHAVGRPAKESPDRLTWGRPPPGASVPQKGLEARPSGRSPSGLTSGASAAIAASRPGKGEESPGARLPLVAWDGPPHGPAGLGLTRRGVHLTDPATGTAAPETALGGRPSSRDPLSWFTCSGLGISGDPRAGSWPARVQEGPWGENPFQTPYRELGPPSQPGGGFLLASSPWAAPWSSSPLVAAAPGGLLPSPGILAVAGEGEDAPPGLLLPLRPPGRPPSPLVPRWPPPPPGSSPKAF